MYLITVFAVISEAHSKFDNGYFQDEETSGSALLNLALYSFLLFTLPIAVFFFGEMVMLFFLRNRTDNQELNKLSKRVIYLLMVNYISCWIFVPQSSNSMCNEWLINLTKFTNICIVYQKIFFPKEQKTISFWNFLVFPFTLFHFTHTFDFFSSEAIHAHYLFWIMYT